MYDRIGEGAWSIRLGHYTDRLVRRDGGIGGRRRSRRPGAEYLAWSAVHGLAMLVIDGPLRRLTTAEIGEISERLIDMVEKGL